MRVADDLKPHNRETIRRILNFLKMKESAVQFRQPARGRHFLFCVS